MTSKSNQQPIHEDFKKLRIQKLEDMINVELAIFGYNISNKKLPKPLLDMLNARGGKKTHRYPTHEKTTLNVQQHTSQMFNRSFLCQSIVEYNKLSDKEKRCKNSKSLGQILKHK